VINYILPLSMITMHERHHEFNAIFSTCKGFRSVSFVHFLREGNGIDDNYLANISRLWTGMQNFWFGCDISVDLFLYMICCINNKYFNKKLPKKIKPVSKIDVFSFRGEQKNRKTEKTGKKNNRKNRTVKKN